jgi:oxygen-independent coproporphyrinogen-3 oxidase
MSAAGLYIHVPFCSGKCLYCDFYSETRPSGVQGWLDGLAREIEARPWPGPAFDTLYLGGGTPSRLTPDQLGQVLEHAHKPTPTGWAEATVEINPEDADPAWIDAALSLGFNRFSIGVQSFDPAVLRWLGRRHSSDQVRRAVRLVAQTGASFGLDLIWGPPGQTPAQWLDQLRQAVDLGPDHLSCYQLTVEPDTPLGRRARTQDLGLPDESRSRELFSQGSGFLIGQGYEHYEVSNFARPGRRSLHNQKYWTGAPYLGLGPAAHSFLGRRRWWNPSDIGAWRENLDAKPEGEILTGEQRRLERIYLGLRTADGFPAELAADRTGRLEALAADGLINLGHGRVRPTTAGLALADRLAAELG